MEALLEADPSEFDLGPLSFFSIILLFFLCNTINKYMWGEEGGTY